METYSPIEFSHDVPKDLPPEILFNPERYSHMLQRRGLYAGFKDLREQLRLKNYKEYTCAELEGKDKPKDDKSDPKVYDFFMYNGEQDILEIRLNTMGPIVDKFLLAETNWTFTGKSKAFQFPGLMGTPGFTKYWDKIVHIQVDPPSSDIGNWERESHHRNRGLQQALHAIDIQEGDFLVIADLDEIIRPSLLAKLKTCTGFTKPHFTPLMPFHYFGFAYWHHRHYWPDGKVLRWTNKLSIDKFEAQGLRFDHAGGVQVKNAGWHCSWCFSNMSQVMSKVQSYSHQEHNQPEFLTRENILNGFRHGYDLFGRTYDQFKYIEDNQDLPDYVALNRDKYEYMLYRRNEWAGFKSSPNTKRIPITQTTLNVAASDHYTSLDVSTTTSRSLLPTPTPTPVSSLCSLINGTDRLQTDPQPSLYDFTLYLGTDLESLNLRLRTLSPFIDTFYIVHPTETVTGKNISTIIPRSALATSKTVIQLEVNPSKYVTKDPKERKDLKYWTFEWKTFDGAYLEFKERVVASGEVPDGSLVIAGRVDEIPRIRALRAVRECNWEKGVYMYALEMERYIYGYQYRRLNPLKVYSTVLQWTEQARKLDGGYVRDGNGDEKVSEHSKL
ncbi:hypothetical protein HDU99_001187 [Rhizoclosmatium hyalinum]|nr:hypothetical protein HDU99_001187 [Rhizoclosmatium hyalinum]